MPEVEFKIGGRNYRLVCDPGQEGELKSAAAVLDRDASALLAGGGSIPEDRVLLLTGLMTADRIKGLEWEVQSRDERIRELEKRLKDAETRPAEAEAKPDTHDKGLFDDLDLPRALELLDATAARLEDLADDLESGAGA